jgi:glycine cleavage system H protein
MKIPENYRFSSEHEWARDEGDGTVTVGISHHAQDALGDIVFVERPEVGSSVTQTLEFGFVESVKTVSDLYAPVSGEVVAINEELEDAPELVNESPYEAGWIVRIRMSDPAQLEELLDAAAYEQFLRSDG